nr:transposase [Haematobacter sp. UBA3484]
MARTDVEGMIGAPWAERSGERSTKRSGYHDRAPDIRLGTRNPRLLKPSQGSYFPGFLEARKTSEQVSGAMSQEATMSLSTRRVDDLVQVMGMSGISENTVLKPGTEWAGPEKSLGSVSR